MRIQAVSAQGSPGSISFSQSAFTVDESAGNAVITLRRTGGTDGEVNIKVTLADVTTTSADYTFNQGALDPTFTPAAAALNSFLYYSGQLALQPDGKILVGASRALVRLNRDGTVDPTFTAPETNAGISSVVIQPNGKIVIGGFFTTVNLVRKNGVARLNSDGTLDNTFDVGAGSTDINVLALQTDGKILAGGTFTSFNQAPNTAYVVRLNTDGSVDATFQRSGGDISTTYGLAVQPDAKVLVASLGGSVARLNPDGSTDAGFASNLAVGSAGLALALQPDGKIIVGGSFNNVGGQTVFNIARLNSDGTLDSSFSTGSGPDFAVQAIRLQPDGKVIIGGDFRSFNGSAKANIARLNANGSLDATFNPNVISPSFIHTLALQEDGKVIAGGSFTMSGNNVNRSSLARVHGDLFFTWKTGDASDKTLNLPIVNDLLDEPDETLALAITPLAGGATVGAIPNATLTILDDDVPPAITSAPPPQGITRLNYSHTFTATGMPTPTFSVTAGTLPPGLFLQSSGLLSGQPTTAGTFSNITVTASNGVAPPATQTFSITILSGGTLQFSSSTYNVGEADGSAIITVTRAGGSAGATSVNFSANFGSATAGSDFTATSGTLNYADGETSKTFTVPVINDSLDESNETVSMFLTSVSGSGILGLLTSATLTIVDDDPPPSISIADVTLMEGNSGIKSAVFNVTLSSASGLFVSVNFATANGTTTAPGTGADYFPTSSSVTFTPGTALRTISIPIFGDSFFELDETFFVNLSNPVNCTISDAQGVGVIQNDDPFLLVLDSSGPAPDQAAAIDSILFLRDPFPILSSATWLDLGQDRNTRVLVFSNVLLNTGQDPTSIVVRLVASDGQIHDLPAEEVSRIFNTPFSQVRFRLPDGMTAGSCLLSLKAHGQTSNSGTIRIAP